ncbi:hypothetical protein [Butyrivibrio fibrisolvens]|uniref:hypothetical protein n=1 Tax=Butyrivibrio fibrisolvens TaxID=831 RepID=UPI0003B44680|nr:hypothetical protein [Butyrivibrio fibrisolvens]
MREKLTNEIRNERISIFECLLPKYRKYWKQEATSKKFKVGVRYNGYALDQSDIDIAHDGERLDELSTALHENAHMIGIWFGQEPATDLMSAEPYKKGITIPGQQFVRYPEAIINKLMEDCQKKYQEKRDNDVKGLHEYRVERKIRGLKRLMPSIKGDLVWLLVLSIIMLFFIFYVGLYIGELIVAVIMAYYILRVYFKYTKWKENNHLYEISENVDVGSMYMTYRRVRPFFLQGNANRREQYWYPTERLLTTSREDQEAYNIRMGELKVLKWLATTNEGSVVAKYLPKEHILGITHITGKKMETIAGFIDGYSVMYSKNEPLIRIDLLNHILYLPLCAPFSLGQNCVNLF